MDYILKYFSELTKEQLQQFAALEALYKEWNEKINVISRKDIDSLYLKHVLHSLSIAAVFNFAAGTEIIDIGTGGGFPGIPLAIYFPDVHFHLVDSIGKKLKVVAAIADSINLNNITIQNIRAEEIKDKQFHFVVSRAVAPLKELWKWSKPLIRKNEIRSTKYENETAKTEYQLSVINQYSNGFICLKGGDLSYEISESGLHPKQTGIETIFNEDYFKEKYLLYQPV